MESFERAHVVRKHNKTDLIKKKQLRQMLTGYKQKNNDLIKHSEEVNDASSSVSGFSDLNLTGSPDTNKSEYDRHEDNVSDSDINSMTSIKKTSDFAPMKDHLSDGDNPKSALELDISSDSVSASSDSSNSIPSKIATKMKVKQTSILNKKELQYNKTKTRKKKNKADRNDTASPPFVSITAKNMLDESFESLVGDYRHSTIKNLPWDSKNFDSHHLPFFNDSNMLDTGSIVLVKSGIDTSSANSADDLKAFDVSEEETDNMEDYSFSEHQSSVESMDTNVINPVRVFYGKNTVVLVLKHPTEIYIHGKVRASALGGSIEIFGYLLQDIPQEVYAPIYNYAPCIKTLLKQNVYYGLFGKLTGSGLTVAEAEEIVTSIGEYDGVICLKPLINSRINFIENNFTTAELFSKLGKNIDDSFKQASQILGCSFYLTRPLKCYVEDPKWHDILKYGHSNSCGIVCGGKGLGKSNFIRYYINSLLANGPVLLVDLDPGQAEFTVAGNLSATVVTQPLLGPAYTHLKRPDVTYNLGLINTMDNPKRYLSAVDDLITYCRNNEKFQNIPWIVNTMGMVNALGLKFMSYIILRFSPTFLLQIDSNNAKKRFECNLTSEEILRCKGIWFENMDCPDNFNYEFFLVSSVENSLKNSSLAPKDERYLNFLAYFAELIHSSTRNGLLGITPYKVSLNDVNVALNVRVDREDLGKVLCGKIVALCEEATNQKRKVFTLSDKPIPCHGHGLIRGIDFEKSELYIVTPVPREILEKVNTIVYADWVPEIRGQEKYLPEGTKVPYRTCTEYQQRQLMFTPRRRFNPIQLLKMSRSS